MRIVTLELLRKTCIQVPTVKFLSKLRMPLKKTERCARNCLTGHLYLHKIIFVALVVAIAVPSSLGRREKSDLENDLRDLCSQTNKTKKCWNIIKSEFSRFSDADGNKGVAGVVIDLSCSKNYNDASRNLDLARRNLDSDDYRNISVQIDDTSEELKSCRHQFKKDSFDPAHIRNRNKEFKIYVEIVKVATDRLLQENDQQPEGNIN